MEVELQSSGLSAARNQAALFVIRANAPNDTSAIRGMSTAFAFMGWDIFRSASDEIGIWDAMIEDEERRNGLLSPGAWVWEGTVWGDFDTSAKAGSGNRGALQGIVRRASVGDFDTFGVPLLANPTTEGDDASAFPPSDDEQGAAYRKPERHRPFLTLMRY